MELGGGNDLGQLFHVGGLDVHDVEALVLNVEVPQVDAQIVTAYKCFAVTVDGDAVDVVGVCVGVRSTGLGRDDGVMMGQTRELEHGGIFDRDLRRSRWPASDYPSGCQVGREVVLRDDFKGLVKDLP